MIKASRGRGSKRRTRTVPDGQMVFKTDKKEVKLERKMSAIARFTEDDRPASCPFCMFTSRIREFFIQLKGGYSTKRFQCPDCSEVMLLKTLTRDMTPTEYARWMYEEVIIYNGYKRISWEKLMKRLKHYGIASEFWTEWKRAKGQRAEEKPQTYEEAFEEQQKEYLEEQKEYEKYEQELREAHDRGDYDR